MKKVELTLPEWAFLDSNTHEGDGLESRDVFIHIRSNTVLEVFDEGLFHPNKDAHIFKFKHLNRLGIIEPKVMVVHYSFDIESIDDIMKAGAKWYCDYLDWLDMGISEETFSKFN